MRRRAAALACSVLGCGALTLTLATSVIPAATGCSTRQCDGHTSNWTTGHFIGPDVWETNDVNGAWIPFDGNSTVNLYWYGMTPGPGDVPRDVDTIDAYIGVAQDGQNTPNGDSDAGDNFINGAGQPVEYLYWPKPGQPQRVTVLNDTCAPYLARFRVTFLPLESDASAAATRD